MRFPEFTEEWEKKTIENTAPLQRGFDLPTQQLENGNIPVVYSNGIMNYHSSYKCVAPGLVTGRSGTVGKFTFISNGCYWPHNTSLWVTDFNDNNPKFIYYLYQTIRIEQYSTGSGVPTLNRNDVHRHKVCIPKLKEQSKISRFLSLIDERIATQNKIIEDLKKLKVAIIDKLYTNIDGILCSYGDLMTVVNKKNKAMKYSNVLSASQELGMIERNDLNIDIKYEESSISSYKLVQDGDYVVHLRSFQGGLAFSQTEGVCSPAYTILRPCDKLQYGYLAPFFTSIPFINSLRLVTYGIRDGRSININEWLDMKVCIPSLDFQRHTLSIIDAVNHKLLNEKTIAIRLLMQRKYLLQQMFI